MVNNLFSRGAGETLGEEMAWCLCPGAPWVGWLYGGADIKLVAAPALWPRPGSVMMLAGSSPRNQLRKDLPPACVL